LLVTDVARSWDGGDISEKIELEIGKDLQYIRLNGTLVVRLRGRAAACSGHAVQLTAKKGRSPDRNAVNGSSLA